MPMTWRKLELVRPSRGSYLGVLWDAGPILDIGACSDRKWTRHRLALDTSPTRGFAPTTPSTC
jgi:hypothetical protein